MCSCFIHIVPGASDNLPGASVENAPTSPLTDGGTEAQRWSSIVMAQTVLVVKQGLHP